MSTMHVAFGTAMGAGAPVFPRSFHLTQAVTTSATTASTTIQAREGDYAHVTAIDAALYVAINKDAAAGVDIPVAVGETKNFGPLKEGDTVSGIEA